MAARAVHGDLYSFRFNDAFERVNTLSLELAGWAVAIGGLLFVFAAARTRARSDVRRATVAIVLLAAAGASAWGNEILIDAFPAQATAISAVVRGFWRLPLPLLLVYSVLKHRLFDVELKAKAAVRRGTVVAAALAVFAAVALAVGWFAGPLAGSGAGVVAAGGLVVLGKPIRRAGTKLADALMPHVEANDEYVAVRKIEVYRTALEEARVRGATDLLREPFLAQLRRGLGLTEQDHRTILVMLQTTPRASASALPPSMAKFTIEKELGRGGFGRVLLARDTALDRRVVLKQPVGMFAEDPQARDLFLKEARIAARIEHPNVVPIYEILADQNPPILVLQYVDGGSLDDLLARKGRLTPEETIQLAVQVLSGLDRIHREGIVHRDLKPANILIGKDGVAKITDFGIAHAPPSGTSALVTVAGTGYQPGSVAYMSPEQARGDGVDARSDLYAIGVVLHQVVAGAHYLSPVDEPDFKLRSRIQSSEPSFPPHVPPALAGVLRRALAKDPAARFTSAAEMAGALVLAKDAGSALGAAFRSA